MTTPTLPEAANLDIRALARTLDNVSASYKFLWTLGLLDEMEKRKFRETKSLIPMRGIFAAMLARADAPVNHFKLSFGASSGAARRDQMESHLKAIAEATGKKEPLLLDSADLQSPKGAALTAVCGELAGYVPLRWLSPFLPQDELRKSSGKTRNQRKRNERIRKLADKRFEESSGNPPPYRLESSQDGECVRIHSDWLEYFGRNLPIVRGWATWKWAEFLQARNPNIPAVLNKIALPAEREGWKNQRSGFWIPILDGADGVNCIYSGAALSSAKGGFDLDHFIPWSFVGHDQIWNLIPASPVANSSKGSDLPRMEKYFAPFVDLHHRALVFHREHSPGKWKKLAEAYVADLRIDFADLTDREKLGRAYEAMVPPLVALAAANKFAPNWTYSPLPRPDALPFD